MAHTSQDIFDGLLIDNIRSGDRKAAELLGKRWHNRLYRSICRFTHNSLQAQDINQEVWLTIWKKLHTLKDPRNFRVWAMRIAYFKSMDWHRSKKHAIEIGELEDKEEVVNEENTALQALSQEMKKLSLVHRNVLKMHYTEGLSVREIAFITASTEGTIKSRLFYARAKLKASIEKSINTNQ